MISNRLHSYKSKEASTGRLRSVQVSEELCQLSFKMSSMTSRTDFFVVTLFPNRNSQRHGFMSGFCHNSTKIKSQLSGAFYEAGSDINLEFLLMAEDGRLAWKQLVLDMDALTLDEGYYC